MDSRYPIKKKIHHDQNGLIPKNKSWINIRKSIWNVQEKNKLYKHIIRARKISQHNSTLSSFKNLINRKASDKLIYDI